MFIRNIVIDKNKTQDVVNNRMFLTYESLKKDGALQDMKKIV